VMDIRAKLSSNRQRGAFDRFAVGQWEALNRSTQFHVAAEPERYQVGVANSALKSFTDNASLNASDPEAVLTAKEQTAAVVHQELQRKGIDPDSPIYTETQLAAQSNVNREVVTSLLYAGNDLRARAYYDANKPDFVAADRDHIERALVEGSTRGEALRQANTI